jgi:hypothetical protein
MKASNNKRSRLAAAAALAAQSDDAPLAEHTVPALANEIRMSLDHQADSQKRSAFIDAQLRKMPEHELVRFEFFIRSHFNRMSVKRVMQAEVDKVRALSPLLISCLDSPRLG